MASGRDTGTVSRKAGKATLALAPAPLNLNPGLSKPSPTAMAGTSTSGSHRERQILAPSAPPTSNPGSPQQKQKQKQKQLPPSDTDEEKSVAPPSRAMRGPQGPHGSDSSHDYAGPPGIRTRKGVDSSSDFDRDPQDARIPHLERVHRPLEGAASRPHTSHITTSPTTHSPTSSLSPSSSSSGRFAHSNANPTSNAHPISASIRNSPTERTASRLSYEHAGNHFGTSFHASSSAEHGDSRSLNSLAPLARDLPSGSFVNGSPRQGTSGSPARSTYSGYGRGSVSSRGSSPLSHASGSSSTSSTRKRRRTDLGRSTVENVNTLRSSAEAPDFTYELVIRQQPGRAAAAGLNPTALSRLPIVPSPILQLVVKDRHGKQVPHSYVVQNLPYLVCSCSLLPSDTEQDNGRQNIDYTTPSPPGTSSAQASSGPLAMLCGTRVYSAIEALDTDGEPGMFFLFWDVSVRQVGDYRLRFTLVEALPGSPTLANVVSEPFDVVQLSQFPGEVEIATDLSRHFQRQGLSIYLPPLGISTGRSGP